MLPSTTDTNIRERMSAFRASVASDLYSATDIIDFASARASMSRMETEITALELVIWRGLDPDELAVVLDRLPGSYPILCSLLSITSSIELEDGRVLPSPGAPPQGTAATTATAKILVELGATELLVPTIDLRRTLLILQTGIDANKRRQRVDQRMRSRVQAIVATAMAEVSSTTNWRLAEGNEQTLPAEARRIVDYVVTVNGEPRIGIVATFQAYSGGRQSRDMTTLYPNLQATLRRADLSLVLIADGRGMRSLSDRVLHDLFTAVPAVLSIRQAESGALATAFKSLSRPLPEPTLDAEGARKLIATQLLQTTSASAASLPLPRPQARLALASYASTNEQFDLILSTDGEELVWARRTLVSHLRKLGGVFEAEEALRYVARLLGISLSLYVGPNESYSLGIGIMDEDPVFSVPFVVGACDGPVTTGTIRDFAKIALQGAPEARLALFVTSQALTATRTAELRRTQPLLPVNVIVVDITTAVGMAQARENPREGLRTLALEQSDLTRISPFVVRSVTPRKAFFGREEEENLLQSTLATNSIALLGGRRIGKTSLMKFAEGRLEQNGFLPHFADCQVVKTWSNFGALANREWNVEVPDDFRPNDLFGVVSALKGSSRKPLVILLDEVDQLLHWDKTHTEDEVPEAFFRACRAISQQGLAQFVFSGERTVATTMWDASSPHWNFCRPLMLQQLTRPASDELISSPLRELGVRIERPPELLQACWDATDGHPELLQYVGDKLVGRLNERDRDNVFAEPEDVSEVTNSYEYAEQYLETYWGQSSPGERIISLLVVSGAKTVQQVTDEMRAKGLEPDAARLQDALRMLELYGIIRKSLSGYELKALGFTRALEFYGGLEATAARYKEAMLIR